MGDAHTRRINARTRALVHAIDVFVHGYGFTRSFTHPYLAGRVGPLWVLRDAPRTHGDYRVEEWIALGIPPSDVDRVAREHTRGRFAVCAIHPLEEPDGPLRNGFQALGYRLLRTEALMVHDLEEVPSFDSPAEVGRVVTAEAAARLAKAAGSRQVLPEHLVPDAPMRQYVATVDGELVGWVRSISVGEATWCSNMYVMPRFRRRGIARAMLGRMLRDDRAGGARAAVLLASHTGAKLYPVVGYRQIGTLLLFMPKKA